MSTKRTKPSPAAQASSRFKKLWKDPEWAAQQKARMRAGWAKKVGAKKGRTVIRLADVESIIFVLRDDAQEDSANG